MNLDQLVQAVYTETNRPDLVEETLQKIKVATLTVHSLEEFYQDIQEALVVFDNPLLYLQQLDTISIPRYRKMVYIRKTDPIATTIEQSNTFPAVASTLPTNRFNFLKRIDAGDIFDNYGYEKVDVWYQAGQQVNIKSSTPLHYVTIGWLEYPNVDINQDGAGYSSWIADQLPYVIVYHAAGSIFSMIELDKAAALYMKQPIPGRGYDTGGLFYQQFAVLQRNNISPGNASG